MDTFDRLPDDVLKYMCLLSVQPKMTLVDNRIIKLELPLLGISFQFVLKLNEINLIIQRLEIEMLIQVITDFNNNTIQCLDFGDYNIFYDDQAIHFYTEYSDMAISIKYLKLLQQVLEEYKNYLLNNLRHFGLPFLQIFNQSQFLYR